MITIVAGDWGHTEMSDLAPSGKLENGRVIRETFAVLRRNLKTFALLAVILVGAPALLLGVLQLAYLKPGVTLSWQTGLMTVVVGLSGLILQGGIMYGTVCDLNGRPVRVADGLSVGLRSFLPMLAIGLMLYIAVVLGMMLLVVPGVMIALAWAVSIPAYVAERTSMTGSFGRSAELTRGNRWRILGLGLLYVVAVIIIEALTGVIANIGQVASGGGVSMLTAVVVTPVVRVVNALFGATGGAVLYVELRRIKDGVGPEGLAAIFD